MPITIRNLRLELDEPEDVLPKKIARRLGIHEDRIRCYAPVRRSVDARKRQGVGFIYAVQVALTDSIEDEQRLVDQLNRADVGMLTLNPRDEPEEGTDPLRHRPVIVGFGPAGMFAGYQLALRGYRPIILERGQPVRIRHRDIMQKFYREHTFNPESNLLFGEGGAGCYSDGKIYTRLNDPYVTDILEVFYHHGAKPSILIDGKPHIGSDRLPNICMRIRKRIESLGGEIRFGARLDDLHIRDDGTLEGISVAGHLLPADVLLLAIGHSARDTLRMLARRGVRMEAKPFQLGVRIEHPQSRVDRWQYGSACGHERLPPADYRLVARGATQKYGDLFSFCMCPGGTILPTNEDHHLISTNGASRAARSGEFANSGLVITLPPSLFHDDPLKGIEYQKMWEQRAYEATGGDYSVPAQRASDFLKNRRSEGPVQTSYPFGATWADIRSLIPREVMEGLENGLRLLDRRMPGFAGRDALITAPETRASSCVRLIRDTHSRESLAIRGLYPVGEGAGYAGGILSAAIDGMKTADCVIRRFAPPI